MGTQYLDIVVVHAALDVLGVYGHDSLVSEVWPARVRNANDVGPFYVMSLPSGFRFNICTSS